MKLIEDAGKIVTLLVQQMDERCVISQSIQNQDRS
jgi:hypothetical protein